MSVKIVKGILFNSKAQTLVNTINTVGVMGAGVALEFRLRYPEMYQRYKELCKDRYIDIGKLWIYKSPQKWILNFPTKKHWKFDSLPEYIEKGLEKFALTYKEKGIKSIAFPILGSSNGNIPEEESLKIMKKYLKKVNIPVEIYRFDPESRDELYDNFKKDLCKLDQDQLMIKLDIKKQYALKLKDALNNDVVKNFYNLKDFKGVGKSVMEKVFNYIIKEYN